STTDQFGYGAGTRLPHNITGLVGVMDGHASDLRTGLPLQMVEIHEPVRLLIVIDATPEAILAAAEKVPVVKNLVVNGWVQLVSWHPDTGDLMVFEEAGFRPYVPESPHVAVVDRSVEWYGGHREHLPPARILAALAPPGRHPLGGGT
ncbi:MAG: putative inorganic carbon transporter subunit DabA, partial [Pirellulales bacterium]